MRGGVLVVAEAVVSECILDHLVGSQWNSCVKITLDWEVLLGCCLIEWCRMSGTTVMCGGVSMHLSVCP